MLAVVRHANGAVIAGASMVRAASCTFLLVRLTHNCDMRGDGVLWLRWPDSIHDERAIVVNQPVHVAQRQVQLRWWTPIVVVGR